MADSVRSKLPKCKLEKEQFKEGIRSDCSYIVGRNLTSSQHVTENDKPHMTSEFRKVIMKSGDIQFNIQLSKFCKKNKIDIIDHKNLDGSF